MKQLTVPYFRPQLGEEEIAEVIAALRSGWLTSGPRSHRFEEEFAAAVGAAHAVAVNSCPAALHLAVEALGCKVGQDRVVPGSAVGRLLLRSAAFPSMPTRPSPPARAAWL